MRRYPIKAVTGDSIANRDRGRQGFVLVIVTIIVVMAGLAGFSFVALMSTEDKAVRLRGDELQVEATVASAVEMMKVLIEEGGQSWESSSDWSEDASLFRAVPLLADTGEQPGRFLFSVIAPQIEDDGISGIRFGMVDESSRLNLPALLQWERRQSGAAQRALMNLPNMTDAIAAALLDWVDPDDRRRSSGAETDYYGSMEPPFDPRNGLPESLEELLLVRDVTPGMIFGADTNRNYQIDSVERSAATGMTSDSPTGSFPWAELLTLHSAERNVRPDGSPRVNLNDRDLTRLNQELNKVLDDRAARFIIAYRQYGRYTGSRPATEEAGFEMDLSVRPRYTLKSILDLVDAKVRIRKPGSRTILASPFTSDQSDLAEYLPGLLDDVTLMAEPVLVGRININAAPLPVLLAVPGMTESIADRILSARSSSGGFQEGSRRNPAWLLTEGLVDLSTMKTILPFVTARGDVYRAQIVGFTVPEGPVKRVEVAIDGARRPARLVYWKDLGVLGPGFSREALGAISELETTSDGELFSD